MQLHGGNQDACFWLCFSCVCVCDLRDLDLVLRLIVKWSDNGPVLLPVGDNVGGTGQPLAIGMWSL